MPIADPPPRIYRTAVPDASPEPVHLSAAARRLPPDRLSLLLARIDAEPPDDDLTPMAAEVEAAALVAQGERGEYHPWLLARTIALARAFPTRASFQIATARLTRIHADAGTAKACWRGVLERFPASPEAFTGYVAAVARADGEAVARAVEAAYSDRPAAAPEQSEAMLAALSALLDRALARRAALPPVRPAKSIGAIALIGGTLGGGGAERQLVNTALALHAASRAPDPVVIGPLTLYCRKLDRRRASDFHLPRLQAAGIRVIDYLRLEPDGGNPALSRAVPHAALISELPERIREGVSRLVEQLRYDAPDVVQIWQDGMIHAAGLAVLLADVPRILLNVRTMPPTARGDRHRPGAELLYRRLLEAPGVSLTTNSDAAARGYEAWLGLPRGSVLVVPNGVDPPSAAPDDEAAAMLRAFEARAGAGPVLGGVQRLDDNKRPLEWLGIAAALAELRPDARFILVGAGPLRAAAEDFAARRGLAERTLFVGRSRRVGFWLSKMDAFALASRHEGLPNALIEAQMVGVPVVTAPAGGAADAVAPFDCNLVLASAQTVDHRAAAEHLAKLAARDPAAAHADAERLRRWAAARYSVEAMIERTIDLFG